MKGFFIFPVLLFFLFSTPAFADFHLKELKLLAIEGSAIAQHKLGGIYYRGRDYLAAVKWFKLAAEQGDAAAQYNLGLKYSKGQDVTQDYEANVKWFKLAAEQGHSNAQYNLGVTYAKGQGVIKDFARAHMWWDIAASQGLDRAESDRDKIEEFMTPAQIEKAQGLANECVAKNYKGC